MKKTLFVLGLLLTLSAQAAQKPKWVTDVTECGITYMSIYCEADQYVCGYDKILNCVKPEDTVSAKKDMVATQDIGTGFGAGLVLDCHAKSDSCLPWRCQSDKSCNDKNKVTKCLKKGGFVCGTCIPGYNDCNGDDKDGCEAKDGNLLSHAKTEGCSGKAPKVICDEGYLNCNGDATDGCEIKIDGPCKIDGKDGQYAKTCKGSNPPTCNPFAQQFVPTQNVTGDSVVSKVQVDEAGSINIPEGENFMIGGVPIAQADLECKENEVQMGEKCLEIPECEFLKFENREFKCGEEPKAVDESKLYPGDCSGAQIRIGGVCQPIPQCELLRFDATNAKFLCVEMESFSEKLETAFVKRLADKCKKEEVLKWNGDSFECIDEVEVVAEPLETTPSVTTPPDPVAQVETTPVVEKPKPKEKSFIDGILDFFFR